MSDLGSIAALKAAVDALLVANGIEDITATEFNALEKDIIDTLFALGDPTKQPARSELSKYANGIATVASATNTDIGGAASNVIKLTGTATITQFTGGSIGAIRFIQVDGVQTWTNNNGSMDLGVTIVTQAGAEAILICTAPSNWRLLHYVNADGSPLAAPDIQKLEQEYPQTAHGFVFGDIIQPVSADTYIKCQANAEATARPSLIVSAVVDANTFKAVQPGSILSGFSGLTAGGDGYFLSGTTAGGMEATDEADISAPVGEALNATTFLFRPFRPSTGSLDPVYTELVLLLSQTGTDAPVITRLDATGLSVGSAYVDVGSYTLTSSSLFTSGKTTITCGGSVGGTSSARSFFNIGWQDASTITLYTIDDDAGSLQDGMLSQTTVLIRIYP